MPTQVRTVRQLEFLPNSFGRGASQVQPEPPRRPTSMLFLFNLLFFLCLTCEQTLGVLSQDGLMRFINIQTCKLLFHLGSHDNSISTVAISPNGRYMAAIMDNGRINVYSIHSLTQTFNKVILSITANSL